MRRRPRLALLSALLGLVTSLQATAATPATLSKVIVQGPGALSAVTSLVTTSGVGRVGPDLWLVGGVGAELSSTQVRSLTGFVVTTDATVLTAGKGGGTAKAPVNVFRQVTEADQVPSAGSGVGVAVVDTGIAPLGDFAGRLHPGVDYSGEGTPQVDGYGHGTFVAGLVAGGGVTSAAYAGEATQAELYPVKVAGRSGKTSVSTVIQGLQWVVDNKAVVQVVNLSLGSVPTGPTTLNPLNQAVEQVWANGIVVVASAGNNGSARGTITSPGDDPLVITAGALDDRHTVSTTDDVVPAFSSHGPTASNGWWKPDLLAPGTSVVSVMPTTSTTWASYPTARVGSGNFVGSGTSFAAAVTSGAVALLLSAHPGLTPDQVKARLLTTTSPGPGPGAQDPFAQGHGVLDVARAVAEPGDVGMTQVLSTALPPKVVPLVTTQGLSWADGPTYPAPYSGTAFESTAWNSTAWNSTAWNSTAWNSTAWNSTAWNSTAWNSRAWNSSTWS